MKLGIRELSFNLPSNPFGQNIENISAAAKNAHNIKKKAGGSNKKFDEALRKLLALIQGGEHLEHSINTLLDVRALAISLGTELAERVDLTQSVLRKILKIRKKPGA